MQRRHAAAEDRDRLDQEDSAGSAEFQVHVGGRRIAGLVEQLEAGSLRQHPGRAQIQ